MSASKPHSVLDEARALIAGFEDLGVVEQMRHGDEWAHDAVELLKSLIEQLETAEARANAAEAFIVRMDMAYRYEEFRLADPNPAKERDPALCRHGYDLTQEAECPLCKAQEALSEWEPARWCRRCGVYGCEHVLPAQSPAKRPT